MHVAPKDEWFVVKAFPHENMSEIVHGTVENKTVMRTGRVIAVGPGRWASETSSIRLPHRHTVGEKVAFLRWHKDHQMGKASSKVMSEWSMELDADVYILHVKDVLAIVRDEDPESAARDVFPVRIDVA